MKLPAQHPRALMLITCAMLTLASCLPIDLNGGSSWNEIVLSSPALRPSVSEEFIEQEPNNEFDIANLVGMGTGVKLIGTLKGDSGSSELDVYELGTFEPGARIRGYLDADDYQPLQLGLFDENMSLLGFVDLARSASGPRSADIVLNESVAELYAVVSSRESSIYNRGYTAQVSVESNYGIRNPRSQVVVLNFNGALNVRIGSQPAVNVPVFDASVISQAFAGLELQIKNNILQMVREDYAGLGVDFYLAGDPAIPPVDLTVIHFGTYSDRLLGLAENIDPFNVDATQSAIIYTDTFALFSVLDPSVRQISQALANVTSHELGHLLGLRHTADVNGIMDITASARQMMQDQWFRLSGLHPSVFMIGDQDAPKLLSWTTGGMPPQSPKDREELVLRAYEMAATQHDVYVPHHLLATNSAEEHEPPAPEVGDDASLQ